MDLRVMLQRWIILKRTTLLDASEYTGIKPWDLRDYLDGENLTTEQYSRLVLFICGMRWEPVIRWRVTPPHKRRRRKGAEGVVP